MARVGEGKNRALFLWGLTEFRKKHVDGIVQEWCGEVSVLSILISCTKPHAAFTLLSLASQTPNCYNLIRVS